MTDKEQVRTAEVIASLCLATDLGMGFPFELGLRATLAAMRLCDVLDVDSDTASQTYYACLLVHSGCLVDAETRVGIFHGNSTETGYHRLFGSPLEGVVGAVAAIPSPDARWSRRAYQLAVGIPQALWVRRDVFTAYCEVAEMLAQQLGLPPSITDLFPFVIERWDGWGQLRRAKGDEVPLPLRITHVCRDATYQRLLGDDDEVVDTIESRGGHAFDPAVVKAFIDNAPEVLGAGEAPESAWEEVLAAEPKPRLQLEDNAIDRALAAMGAFSDLASPYFSGHASRVGQIASEAARLYGIDEAEIKTIRRAGYIHDLGRAGVHPRIWTKAGPLTVAEWEEVRLHPYHTERVLSRSSFLAPLGALGSSHHERLDGSGYHRGINAAALHRAARLLAAADAYCAKTEPRAYRGAYSPEKATRSVVLKAGDGKLDPDMVALVVEAAGQEAPRIERPAGLTEREVEVVGLLAHGMQTKQVARALDISVKTADFHIQNSYRKMGVSTRAAATLFAMEHGLVTWENSQ